MLLFFAMELSLDSRLPLEPVFSLESPSLNEPSLVADGIDSRSDSKEPLLLPQESFSQKAPLGLDGPVDDFDAVRRAAEIAKQISRKWCGHYQPFGKPSNVEVILTFSKVTPMEQMVDLRGDMNFGRFTTKVQGNLNAKSGQLDLLPLSDQLSDVLEPGGQFIGLQGLHLLGWDSSGFSNLGGRLELSETCVTK